jgi:threonine dehydrogenase-like Zn-dependent dehydrogenase
MTALVYDIGPLRWMACKAAGWITPAVFRSRLSGLRLRRVPVPALPSPEWVRLRTILGGICGTDLAAITQRNHPASILQAFAGLPAVVGHENVARVEEAGPAVRRYKPGDRVVVEPILSCVPRGVAPVCPACSAGRFALCEHFRTGPLPPGYMIGWNSFTGGSWGPYFVAHESQLHRVPDELGDDEAVLTDPLASALHAVMSHGPAAGARVLILGAGLVGMGVAAALGALDVDCRLTAVVRHPGQAEAMRRLGVQETIRLARRDSQADRYGRIARCVGGAVVPTRFGHQAFIGGFDQVFDCIGTCQSLSDAMKYARAGGVVVEVGTTQIGTVDTAPLWFDELKLVGANGRAIEEFEGRRMHTYEVLWELVRRKRLDLKGLLTHRFPIERYRDALAALSDRGRSGAVKVAFTHE